MRRLVSSLAALAFAAALSAPAVALAGDGPLITRFWYEDSRSFPAGTRCPFAVEAHRSGYLVIADWLAADGSIRTEAVRWANGTIVYTNPANSRSLTTRLAGPQVVTDNGDGTSTVFTPGNDQAAVVPGLGFLDGRTGLSVLVVDNATGAVVDVLVEAGHQTSPFPAGCVALA